MGRKRIQLSYRPIGAIRGPAATMLRALAAMAAILVATPAFAQQDGTLIVDVVDETELEVPDATVTLSGPNLIGGSQSRVTDLTGRVKFTALPPAANYQVVVTHETLQPATVNNVNVTVGAPSRLTVNMSGIEEIVVEQEQQAINTESTSRGTVLTKDFLQAVPTGRSYQQALNTVAGVGGASGTDNMGGAQDNENTYMVDGANVTDPVTGTFGANFNFDAIQQIEVLLGGYMPEYGVSIGGVVNLVTESGSNNLAFDSSIYYTNGNLRPRLDERVGHDGVQLAPSDFESNEQALLINAKVSGPIIRDKAFFILSYQDTRRLSSFSGTPQRRDFHGHYVYGKLTFQPTSEHRFTFGLQTQPTSVANTFQGSPFIKAESQGHQAQNGLIAIARWQWFLSPDINLDTVVNSQDIYIQTGSVPCTHDRKADKRQCRPGEEEGEIDWFTPGRVGTGGAYDSVNNINFSFNDRSRLEVNSKLAITNVEDPLGGTHDIKIGIGTEQLSSTTLRGINGNLYYYDTNAASYDPSTFTNYYWFEYSTPIEYTLTGSIYNFFVQDSWKPVKNLTINYGTRYDNSVMRNDQGEAVIKANLWGPRLFAAWDPWGDQKTKIATGWGRFNDRGRLAVANYTSASGFGSKLFFGEYFDLFQNSSSDNFAYTPIENLNTAYDKLRNPRTDEVILQIQREVVTDLVLESDMSVKFTRNLYEPDETTLAFSQNGDSVIGSRRGDFNNLYGRLRTPELARRDAFQWTLGLRKTAARNWTAGLFYTYTGIRGTSNGSLSGNFLIDPQTQWNYGTLQNAVTNQFQGYLFWQLPTAPYEQQIGAFFYGHTGLGLDRTYYASAGQTTGNTYGQRLRPRGTYAPIYPPEAGLSLQFRQFFTLPKGKLSASVELTNLLNFRGGGGNDYGQVLTDNRLVRFYRQDPFAMQFGARYEF